MYHGKDKIKKISPSTRIHVVILKVCFENVEFIPLTQSDSEKPRYANSIGSLPVERMRENKIFS